MGQVALYRGQAAESVSVGDAGATFTNIGPDIVYYGDANVSATINSGALAVGASAVLVGSPYLVLAPSSTRAYVNVASNPSSATSGVPYGGTIDQVLTKLSSLDSDAGWSDLPISPIEGINTVATAGGAQTLPDVTAATIHFLTLTSAFCALTLPTPFPGKSFTVVLKQDATGSRTVAWPFSVVWPGGVSPTLTATAGAFDVFSFLSVNGTNWLGFVRSQATVPTTDPSTISGLQGWWKADVLSLADGDKVASWPDSSGNSRTPVQATAGLQPVFKVNIQNGRPVVRCAGASEVLVYTGTSGLAGKASYSVFYAYASNRGVSGAQEYLYHAGTAGADHAIAVGLRNINPGGTDTFTVTQYADDGDITASNSSAFNVLSAVKSAASGCQMWRNGTSLGTSALPSGTFSPTTDQVRLLMSTFGGSTIGDVGEILVYDSALSTSNRQKIEAYLKAKWNTP